MDAIRLLIDPPAAGAWNMAVDEALLESAALRGIATLRFYQWETPTLSLGYFQSAADREQHPGSRSCPLVRRASGGGAIVHDRELTYSVALLVQNTRAKGTTDLYSLCHESLVAALARFHVNASLWQLPCAADAASAVARGRADPQPFLCFARRSCGDIVIGEFKIVGSAQRRRREAVLQHGSILLSESPCARELPGIAQLVGRSLSPEEFAVAWTGDLVARLQAKAVSGELSDLELAAVHRSQTRFASAEYTQRR